MTDAFTASNGVGFEHSSEEGIIFATKLSTTKNEPVDLRFEPKIIAALREFFRDEEDKRLGRWRYVTHPAFVVYLSPRYDDGDGRAVVVMDEYTGRSDIFWESLPIEQSDGVEGEVARAYFAAHPEPKPWQSPVTGQVWALSLDGDEHTAWAVNHDNLFMDAYSTLDPKSRMITDGRRIWPEGDA